MRGVDDVNCDVSDYDDAVVLYLVCDGDCLSAMVVVVWWVMSHRPHR